MYKLKWLLIWVLDFFISVLKIAIFRGVVGISQTSKIETFVTIINGF